MADIRYDNEAQYKRVVDYVIPGETLHAVFDCKGAGTGFVGLTDQRVLFYDQGVFIKRKTMISLPYSQIVGVASADEGTWLKTSEIIIITAAGRFSFEFRGGDKAHWAYRFIVARLLYGNHQKEPAT